MSRASQKSGLSPSITKGSNRIDLGKNSGVDMGRKAQPSVTSGGIGITQEVTNIAGVSVSAGANVDITPVDFGISVNPSEGTVSVSTGAEVPGGLIGISGGIEVNTNTGQIIGGSIGGEALGLGINVSNSSEGGLGVEFTVQIPGTPIELSLGFGFPPEPKTPSPSPGSGTSVPSFPPPPGPFPEPPLSPLPLTGDNTSCTIVVSLSRKLRYLENNGYEENYFTKTNGSAKRIDGGSLEVTASGFYTSASSTGKFETFSYPPITSILGWRIMDSGVALADNIGGIVGVSGPQSIVHKYINGSYHFYDSQTLVYETLERAGTYSVIYSDCPLSSTVDPPANSSSKFSSPFANPPPRKRNMDECCRDSTKLLREIHKRLGISKFPGKLPETIIQETPKEGEQPAEPAQVPIEDFVDLLNWQFERDDERWGQWQVEIAIKDSDITKEGDQPKQIKLPNLAESIGEFQGQLLSIMTNVDALVAIQVKTLAESGMARQEAIKGYLAAKAIIKYMAFKSTEIDVTVPLTFTAGAETISDLLKESEGHIKGTDYEEKETLRDIIADLLQAAAIIRAVHWQRIDTKSDTKSQLLNILKGSVDLAAKITRPQNPNAENNEGFNPEKDFEDFIDSVEDGFRNTTGITDGQNPYGKSPDRRPRIRQIGDNVAQAGGNS
jgi:hypothetical protein